MWQLSSRELAYLLWAVVLLVWMLSMSTMRASIAGILRHLLNWKLSLPIVLLAAYTLGLVRLLARFELWGPALTKDTIVWFLFSGLAFAGSAVERAKDERFWRDSVAKQLKLMVIVEWIVHENTLSFGVELLLVPLFVGLGIFSAVASSRSEFKLVARLLSAVITASALVLIGLAVHGAILTRNALDVPKAIQTLVLPALLTVGLLPAVFLFAAFASYENLFVRLGAWRPGRGAFGRSAALRILAYCWFRPHLVHAFAKKYVIETMQLRDKRDLVALLEKARKGEPGEAELDDPDSPVT